MVVFTILLPIVKILLTSTFVRTLGIGKITTFPTAQRGRVIERAGNYSQCYFVMKRIINTLHFTVMMISFHDVQETRPDTFLQRDNNHPARQKVQEHSMYKITAVIQFDEHKFIIECGRYLY